MLRTFSSSIAMSVSSSHGFTSKRMDDLAMRVGSEGDRGSNLLTITTTVTQLNEWMLIDSNQKIKDIHQKLSRKMVMKSSQSQFQLRLVIMGWRTFGLLGSILSQALLLQPCCLSVFLKQQPNINTPFLLAWNDVSSHTPHHSCLE